MYVFSCFISDVSNDLQYRRIRTILQQSRKKMRSNTMTIRLPTCQVTSIRIQAQLTHTMVRGLFLCFLCSDKPEDMHHSESDLREEEGLMFQVEFEEGAWVNHKVMVSEVAKYTIWIYMRLNFSLSCNFEEMYVSSEIFCVP